MGLAMLALAGRVIAGTPAVTLQTTAEINSVGTWNLRQPHPLHLEGVVTCINRERRLLVVQDVTGAVALEVEPGQLDFAQGHKVSVEAMDCWPTLAMVPDFPLRPSGRELLSSFEAPTDWNRGYVARVRGYIHPPASGEYRFWISSDDTSELWLGNDDPASARPIASVATWVTKPRELNHLPGQQSAPVFLENSRRYYIEAVHEQRWASDHLSVSWEGPGVPQQVIDGRDLSPWLERSAANASLQDARGHILREYWFARSIDHAGLLTVPRRLESTLAVAGATIRDLGPGATPPAREAHPGELCNAADNFTWAEMEGTVEFVARRGDTLTLELSDGPRRSRVIVQNWRGDPPLRLDGRRVRLAGVAETAFNDHGERVEGALWVPGATTIPVVESSLRTVDAPQVSVTELLSNAPNTRRYRAVKLRGRVVESKPGEMKLRDSGSFSGYVSTDGATWKPLGQPVEIAMGETIEVGLVVSSRSTEKIATGVFDRIDGLTDTPTATAVGGPTSAGQSVRHDGTYTLHGSGHDIWFSPDQFYFVHRQLTGAGEIIARITQFDAADPWAKGGLMMRESLAPDAQFVDLVQTGANGACLQSRKTAEGSAPSSTGGNKLQPPCWFKLERRFATIFVRGERLAAFPSGKQVEVTGYVMMENGLAAISDAVCRELAPEPERPAAVVQVRPLVAVGSITGPADDAPRYDVFRARGVVTFVGEVAGRRYLSIQDHSGAAFVSGEGGGQRAQIRAGQFVEFHNDPRNNAPSPDIATLNIYVQGQGVLPAPVRHPLEYSLPRRGEASRIELEGVIRGVAFNGLAEMKEKGELFSIAVAGAGTDTLRRFVDSRVRVRGVIAFPTEHERLLLVASPDDIEIVEASPEDPFSLPTRMIGEFTPAVLLRHSMHRVKVRGVVTLSDRGHLYLQDDTRGARVELAGPASAKSGDEIEVAGFPELAEDRSLILTGALLRRVQTGPAPSPLMATAEEILSGRFGARLVRVDAIVSRARVSENDATFELQLDQRIFRASLNGPTKDLPAMPPGSLVAITGVCVLETALPDWIKVSAGTTSILPAQLLLRSTNDLVVLQKPRWWAVKRTLLATSVVVFVLSVALVWIHILRRRVAQRTGELHAAMEKLQRETQTAATLAERNRLAGEIHDSLEQGFSGLILQLDTTAKHGQCPAEVRAGLTLARNMVAFSRNEVRHAVWDLQSPVLQDSDLGSALKKIAEQLAPETPHTDVSVEGRICQLGSAIEHHLLRIAQEAVTNCVKHAGARNLHVALRYEESEVVLSIRDDGVGFVPANVLTGGLGHFGLRSLRGRASKIQGTLKIASEPGQGTTVEVRVATPPSVPA